MAEVQVQTVEESTSLHDEKGPEIDRDIQELIKRLEENLGEENLPRSPAELQTLSKETKGEIERNEELTEALSEVRSSTKINHAASFIGTLNFEKELLFGLDKSYQDRSYWRHDLAKYEKPFQAAAYFGSQSSFRKTESNPETLFFGYWGSVFSKSFPEIAAGTLAAIAGGAVGMMNAGGFVWNMFPYHNWEAITGPIGMTGIGICALQFISTIIAGAAGTLIGGALLANASGFLVRCARAVGIGIQRLFQPKDAPEAVVRDLIQHSASLGMTSDQFRQATTSTLSEINARIRTLRQQEEDLNSFEQAAFKKELRDEQGALQGKTILQTLAFERFMKSRVLGEKEPNSKTPLIWELVNDLAGDQKALEISSFLKTNKEKIVIDRCMIDCEVAKDSKDLLKEQIAKILLIDAEPLRESELDELIISLAAVPEVRKI